MATRRRAGLWLVLACVLGAVVALAWVTRHALRMEHARAQGAAEAELEQRVREALWRMDSTIANFLASEASRPYFQYQAFYGADRAYTRMWEEIQPGEVLSPSPLLVGGDPFVRLYYERAGDGTLHSPQAPDGTMRDLAEQALVSGAQVALASQRLGELREVLASPTEGRDRVRLGMVLSDEAVPRADDPAPAGAEGDVLSVTPAPGSSMVGGSLKAEAAWRDYAARRQVSQSAAQSTSNMSKAVKELDRAPATDQIAAMREVEAKLPPDAKDAAGGEPPTTMPASEPAGVSTPRGMPPTERKLASLEQAAPPSPTPSGAAVAGEASGLPGAMLRLSLDAGAGELDVGPFLPAWVGGPGARRELVFRRQVRSSGGLVEQGMWIDWEKLRASLRRSASDLLPEADLRPVAQGGEVGRLLASIPAEIIPNESPTAKLATWTTTRTILSATWVAVLGALAAVAMALRAATDLAERRGRFVSAVTHELRTPITTFQMYSQMLAEGMVEGEASRTQYHQTLHRESRRLAEIVESVLEYARLGRGANGHSRERTTVGELFDRVAPTLRERCSRAGLELAVSSQGDTRRSLSTDPSSIERVLHNLVDNACKYAGAGPDKRVHLDLCVEDAAVRFLVSDHGPGIAEGDRDRLFQAFERGTRQQDGSIPGLGLGLALSLGLARDVGGTLRLGDARRAEFVLELPLERA